MSTTVRFTKILTAVALTASLAACNDLAPTGAKKRPVVTTTEPPKPIEAPTPTEARRRRPPWRRRSASRR